MALGPHVVHAVEHRGPVLRLGAARAGVEGQDRVVRVVLAREQGRQAHRLGLFGEGGELALQLLEHGRVVLLAGHLAERIHVVPGRAELFIALDLALERLEALLHLLGLLHVVPEAVARAHGLELLDLLRRGLELERAAQDLERRLRGVEPGFVFFKFQHIDYHFQDFFKLYYYIQKARCCKSLFLSAFLNGLSPFSLPKKRKVC